jgi:hypothetical protein
MTRLLRTLRIALAALLLALATHATHPALADENPLLGKWLLKGDGNQGALVTEFTPTTMSFTSVGPGNQPQGASKTAQVKAYRKLTESYEIELASGTSFVAKLEDPNTMWLFVPNTANAARYVRMNQ